MPMHVYLAMAASMAYCGLVEVLKPASTEVGCIPSGERMFYAADQGLEER